MQQYEENLQFPLLFMKICSLHTATLPRVRFSLQSTVTLGGRFLYLAAQAKSELPDPSSQTKTNTAEHQQAQHQRLLLANRLQMHFENAIHKSEENKQQDIKLC